MSAEQPEDREPWWRVLSIHDDEGTGIDFAYTVGLHDRGFPELHVWARPDRGTDPGADWMFSDRDRATLLNTLAWRLIDGELTIGQEWQVEYDAGMASVDFRLDPPGDREHLEAFQIDPDAQVLPVSWSINRLPAGPRGPLSDAALAAAPAELAAALADIRSDVRPGPPLPPDWELPQGTDDDSVKFPAQTFDPEQWLGPRTPFVMARAAMLSAADEDDWLWLTQCLGDAMQVDQRGYFLALAEAAARPVGRTAAVEDCGMAAEDLVRMLTGGDHAEQWRHFVARVAPEDHDGYGELWQTEAAEHLAALLIGELTVLFAVEVVADQLPPWVLLAVRGPWLAGLRRDGDLPGPDWAASDSTIERVLSLLAPLSLADLRALPVRDEELSVTDEGYQDMVCALRGAALTGPGGCPQGALTGLPSLAGQAFAADVAVELQSFASVLTAAFEFGVGEAERELLVRAHGQVLPGLDTLPRPDAAGAAHRDR